MRALIRAGEGQDGYRRLAREQADFRRRLEQVLAAPVESTTPTRATSGGDRRKLRGVPCVGPGIRGAVAGTVPHVDGLR